MIIIALAVVWKRSRGLWRTFYGSLLCLFVLIAAGNLMLSVAIDHGEYPSSLSPADRESAQVIQQQVHRAQAAVNSLRNTLRNADAPHPTPVGERGDS